MGPLGGATVATLLANRIPETMADELCKYVYISAPWDRLQAFCFHAVCVCSGMPETGPTALA